MSVQNTERLPAIALITIIQFLSAKSIGVGVQPRLHADGPTAVKPARVETKNHP